MKKKHEPETFTIRFLGGPHDGASRFINCDSPPDHLIPKYDPNANEMWIRWAFAGPGKKRVAVYRSKIDDWDDPDHMKTHFMGYEGFLE